MSGVFISLLAFIFAISVLVAVHEFGHFWVARKLGIKVLRFSIGFGKPLWRRVSGADQTEYVIATIPLGGYVKMLDGREGEVPAAELHRAFNTQPIPKRMAVLVAGPLFNFFFAIAAYWLIFVLGVPGLRPLIGDVSASSPADIAGVRASDEIVAVGGQNVATWESALVGMLDEMLSDGVILMRLRDEFGNERAVSIDVRGSEYVLTEPGALLPGLGIQRWLPERPAVFGEISPNGPADLAALRVGDQVVAANGEPISNWVQFVQFVRAQPGREVILDIERDGAGLTRTVQLEATESNGEIIGRIGVAAAPLPPEMLASLRAEQRYGPLKAIGVSLAKTWSMSALTLRLLWNMITGDVSVKNISGPINIAQYAGFTAKIGLVPFLSFLAIVSISLGILNLLPIPLLDGGQLLFQFVELIKGSPLSARAELLGQQIGIGMLIVLMGFAFYNDIARLLS